MNERRRVIKASTSILRVMQAHGNWVPNPRTRYKPGGSTGNMAFNALQSRIEGDRLIIFVSESVAPYFPYTNEPWTAPRWHGKKNPNEGWVQKFNQEFARRLANRLKGEIIK